MNLSDMGMKTLKNQFEAEYINFDVKLEQSLNDDLEEEEGHIEIDELDLNELSEEDDTAEPNLAKPQDPSEVEHDQEVKESNEDEQKLDTIEDTKEEAAEVLQPAHIKTGKIAIHIIIYSTWKIEI